MLTFLVGAACSALSDMINTIYRYDLHYLHYLHEFQAQFTLFALNSSTICTICTNLYTICTVCTNQETGPGPSSGPNWAQLEF